MAQFPEVDPDTLLQALRTYITARQNVGALANGGSANYLEVLRGFADAVAGTQNPSNAFFKQEDELLFSLLQQQGGGSSTGSLLFSINNSPLLIGQWVYQVSTDTVDLADFSLASAGPVVGVVVALPTEDTVLVQNTGAFAYTPQSFPFLPLTPDTLYYIGSSGALTSTPNAPAGGYTQEIGYAKNTTQVVLNLRAPILV